MSTAFVLSVVASLGAVQVGRPHALFEPGIYPDMVVGVTGAIYYFDGGTVRFP